MTNTPMDWADEIAERLAVKEEHDREVGNDCTQGKDMAVALRKAKADGMREAAQHYENLHPYQDIPLGSLTSPFAMALYKTANKIENPS